MRQKRAVVKLDNKLASRSVNEGFSGGEKKRNEIFQMARARTALLRFSTEQTVDSTSTPRGDSCREASSKLKTSQNATIVITHYQRLLDYIKARLRAHSLTKAAYSAHRRPGTRTRA